MKVTLSSTEGLRTKSLIEKTRKEIKAIEDSLPRLYALLEVLENKYQESQCFESLKLTNGTTIH